MSLHELVLRPTENKPESTVRNCITHCERSPFLRLASSESSDAGIDSDERARAVGGDVADGGCGVAGVTADGAAEVGAELGPYRVAGVVEPADGEADVDRYPPLGMDSGGFFAVPMYVWIEWDKSNRVDWWDRAGLCVRMCRPLVVVAAAVVGMVNVDARSSWC
jgi:hypothetical protein